jgi:hypothetical protein
LMCSSPPTTPSPWRGAVSPCVPGRGASVGERRGAAASSPRSRRSESRQLSQHPHTRSSKQVLQDLGSALDSVIETPAQSRSTDLRFQKASSHPRKSVINRVFWRGKSNWQSNSAIRSRDLKGEV